MDQIVIIFLFIIVLAGLSWRSLRHPGSHGFYRFFAWVAILIQIVINIPHWFNHPFSVMQLVSWFLLTISIYLAGSGFYLLRRSGGPREKRRESANFQFEDTTHLITSGIYGYIRHPMYSSLLFLSWGVFFKRLSWQGIVASLLATLFLFLTAIVEEKENLKSFGPGYAEYRKKTKMFIPFFL